MARCQYRLVEVKPFRFQSLIRSQAATRSFTAGFQKDIALLCDVCKFVAEGQAGSVGVVPASNAGLPQRQRAEYEDFVERRAGFVCSYPSLQTRFNVST